MDKFIFFKNNYFNVQHITRVEVLRGAVEIHTTDGKHLCFRECPANKGDFYGFYAKEEREQFLKDLKALTHQ